MQLELKTTIMVASMVLGQQLPEEGVKNVFSELIDGTSKIWTLTEINSDVQVFTQIYYDITLFTYCTLNTFGIFSTFTSYYI